MGDDIIEEVYADIDTDDVSEDEFRAAVEEKVEQMGGLADEETAAMLLAHELRDEEVQGIADVRPGMEDVKFLAKVTSVGDLRTFERDDENEDGTVLNADVADETGRIRVTFWDEQAVAADDDLEVGQTLRIAGRPREGYSGLEISVDRVEVDDDADIDVQVGDDYRVEDLSLGLSDVTLRATVLGTEPVRTFDRDDGSEGKVANLVVGDETGRVRVTLWDERAGRAEELAPDAAVEIVDGYVRDRDGTLELHVGNRGRVEEIDEEIDYVPDATPIETLEIGQTVDVAGVVRSADPKRTFDRDDGSEGQVRNIRVQDETGDIRLALWGATADEEVGPGDELLLADVEIQDGWQDDIEASAGWQSTIVRVDDGATAAGAGSQTRTDAGAGATGDAGAETEAGTGLDAFTGDGGGGGGAAAAAAESAPEAATTEEEGVEAEGEAVEFTGIVVQAGDPVILDDGERTVTVATDADLTLGEEVTARGTLHDGRLDAEDVL